MCDKNVSNTNLSINQLLSDPLIQAVMTADRVCVDDLRVMLEDVAQRLRIVPLGRPSVVPGDISIETGHRVPYRRGVGMMVVNTEGEVLVARRIGPAKSQDKRVYWQMPQGGIEPGESPRQAAMRELREEIGTDRVEIIAESPAWVRYDLPAALRLEAPSKAWHGQEQKWFLMRYMGDETGIDVATEHPEFSSWRWVSPAEVSDLVIHFKRDLYRQVMEDLFDAQIPA
jgi:putative (di)nucleoside polyphosphate hydrolase